MNIDDYCTLEGTDDYLEIKQLISLHGAEFESDDVQLATDYFNSLDPKNGPVYIIKENATFQFIIPVQIVKEAEGKGLVTRLKQ